MPDKVLESLIDLPLIYFTEIRDEVYPIQVSISL